MAAVAPAGERVPRPGFLVGEAELRPQAVTPRGSGSPLDAGEKGGLRVPLGQEGGPGSPCTALSHALLVRGPPGLPHPLPGIGTSVGPLISPPAWVPVWDPQPGDGSPPSTSASTGPQFQSQTLIPVWVSPSWYRCQHDTPPPRIKPQFHYGCWCGTPHPSVGPHPGTGLPFWHGCPYGISVPVLSCHPSTAANMGSPIPVQDTPFPYWVPMPVWVLEWDLPSWYETPCPGTGSPSQYSCQYDSSHPSRAASRTPPIPVQVLV